MTQMPQNSSNPQTVSFSEEHITQTQTAKKLKPYKKPYLEELSINGNTEGGTGIPFDGVGADIGTGGTS